MSLTTQTTQTESQVTGQLRRAREVLAEKFAAAEPLFDTFWRSGELALLFGEPGVGKSVLAVQVADSLARGRAAAVSSQQSAISSQKALRVSGQRSAPAMDNGRWTMDDTGRRATLMDNGRWTMDDAGRRKRQAGAMLNGKCSMRNAPRRRRKVLYVDLVLNDRQFAERYGGYKVSANLYRGRPAEGEDLLKWVRAMIAKHDFKAVVIDDLSMVWRTDDGTRETLELMRELRRLTVESGVSVLVLADSFPTAYERGVAERGLRRSRVLCGVADSVFALGFSGSRAAGADKRVLVQTRSRSGEVEWTHEHAAVGAIERRDDGFLAMEFAAPQVNAERREMIIDIKQMHDEDKLTFREIAEELDISKSHAQRLYAEWRPEFEESQQDESEQRAVSSECRREAEAELAVWQDEIDENVDYESLYRDHPEMDEHPERWTLELLAKYRFDPDMPLISEESPYFDEDESGESGKSRELAELTEFTEWESGESGKSGKSGELGTEVGRCDEAIAKYAVSGEALDTESDDPADDEADETPPIWAPFSGPCVIDAGDEADEMTQPRDPFSGRCVIDVEAKVSEPAVAIRSATERQITGLEKRTDGYGKEIFVEQWNPVIGKPTIWYKRQGDGFHRFERAAFGIDGRRVDASVNIAKARA